ncbi:MAG TPA: serine/threonine-protein kinase [Gemmatimonadaceae bacterium]
MTKRQFWPERSMTELAQQLQKSVGEDLVIERELGGGGMSHLFVAREATLGRTIVVKVLSAEIAGAIDVQRFRREVQVLARLQHTHIVAILATGEAGPLLYYTMRLVEGESLRQRIVREGALPIGDVVMILRDVLGALAYAHRRGVIHRDIKPENVLLSEGGALVADFGIAKAMSDARTSAAITAGGVMVGTPAYIAPEQAAADPTMDGRVDIYALGAVAYEMLAGEQLFAGLPPHRQMAAHAIQTPVPLNERRSDLPPGLEMLIMQCLAKDPGDRPASADEMLQALDSVATSRGHIRPSAMRGVKAVSLSRSPLDAFAEALKGLLKPKR